MNMSCGALHHQNDACYDCFNANRQNDTRLRDDCSGPEGTDGVHAFCDPEHDNKKCFAEMNQTCPTYYEKG